MKIKKRLEAIIKLVEKNKYVIDVGTDHGLVPLYLAKEGISDRILACDISEKCLDKLNRSMFNPYKNIIATKVTDGFNGIKQEDNQIAIIAGMGALTIIDIISQNLSFAKNLDYMIIQSNVGNERLRSFLVENDFEIKEDFIIKENKKYYDIMKVQSGLKQNYMLHELYFGKDNISNHSKLLEEKLKEEFKKNTEFLIDIKNFARIKKSSEICEVKTKLKAIREVFNIWKLDY